MNGKERKAPVTYKIIMNSRKHYALWLTGQENPPDWRDIGEVGTMEKCLAYLLHIWTLDPLAGQSNRSRDGLR
jgi:uncharacterized protein YbdZ (MbtH family)